jgi:hypothetical protein
MRVMKVVGAVVLLLTIVNCAGRQIYVVTGCDERLESPYKQGECRRCVERPVPHKYEPDNADGERCVLR